MSTFSSNRFKKHQSQQPVLSTFAPIKTPTTANQPSLKEEKEVPLLEEVAVVEEEEEIKLENLYNIIR